MPLVSVVMPFHRAGPLLKVAAASIVGQTLPDWELIAVDDGCGAGAAAVGAAASDPRVRVVPLLSGRGISAARNAGIAMARGEFVALFDSDDISWPLRLERQVAALRADPGLDLIGCHSDIIDADSRRIGWQFTLTSERDQRIFSRYSLPLTSPTSMGRRASLVRHAYRECLSIAEDQDVVARINESGRTAALAEPLYSYRTHAGQTSLSEPARLHFYASVVRLASARRRAGRGESLEELLHEYADWVREPPPPAKSLFEFARRSLKELFPDMACYHARRAVGSERTGRNLAAALRIYRRALDQAPECAVLLTRLFFTGPLRAHGLRPVVR